MSIRATSTGSFNKTIRALQKISNPSLYSQLNAYGAAGVAALASATRQDTGKTAASWDYEIRTKGNVTSIIWVNNNVVAGGTNVALLLQYGHGTGTGGWVQGYDYINPAIKPVMDKIADDIWRLMQAT
ncbi:HK97 gp10 family phage protein [Candidatus Kaiserbacteria bacterium]|nr:HK97 gp10 family phage protein [Candidatus Kaiserbacteria bacterium]